MNLIKGLNLVKINNCTKCHGDNLNKPLNNSYPKLKGQNYNYIFFSLLSYKITNKNFYKRINFIMLSQIQNLSICDIKIISFFISKN